MEPQGTNRKVLQKGVTYLAIALPLLFLGPIVIHSALKNQANPFFIPVFGVGCIVCLSSMFLLFKGINTIMKSLFGK